MAFSVLMVCTGNICRSPMAEGFLTHLLPIPLKPLVSVSSAGTHALHGNRAAHLAVQAAAAHGVDISEHRATFLNAGLIKAADLVLGMEKSHLDGVNHLLIFRCKYARLLGSFAHKRENTEIDDPYGQTLDAYETAAEAILECMPGLIAYIQGRLTK